jgi:hypothetical protein
VGISTGGSIAQQFAIDHPQLVRRLVLVATACRLGPTGRQMQRDLARFTLAGQPRRAWAATGPELATTTIGGRLYAALLWLFGAKLNPEDPSDMLVVIDAEDRFDAAPRLRRITAPTLVIAGDRDRNYTPELFWETAEGIPGARLRLYRGKGHASISSLAYKPAVREILGFLTADEPAPATHPKPKGAPGPPRSLVGNLGGTHRECSSLSQVSRFSIRAFRMSLPFGYDERLGRQAHGGRRRPQQSQGRPPAGLLDHR